MSGVDELAAVVDFATGEINAAELAAVLGTTSSDLSQLGVRLLRHGLRERDGRRVEAGMMLQHYFGFGEHAAEVLTELAAEDWHSSHEDIAFDLGRMRHSQAVIPLRKLAVAQLPYLAYDDSFALGTKCAWSLGHIQTPDAVDALRILVTEANQIVSNTSREQLLRVADEAVDEGVRERARSVLRELAETD